jgi:hypothetical protein
MNSRRERFREGAGERKRQKEVGVHTDRRGTTRDIVVSSRMMAATFISKTTYIFTYTTPKSKPLRGRERAQGGEGDGERLERMGEMSH